MESDPKIAKPAIREIFPAARQDIFPIIAFAAVFTYLAVFILWPFATQNNLFNYDMGGMYFSSWYTAHYLFPNPIGWNPFFFAGFAQNQFYGPLFPYLVSIASLALPTEIAFKAVLGIVFLLMPVSFYYFARSFGFGRDISSAVMLLMFSLLFAFPFKSYGGDIYSAFGTGLVASALALPLFFFYFGSMRRNIGTGNFYYPAILLALIALSHSLTSLAALFIPLGFLLSKPDKKTLKFIALHLLLALLLCGFWLVPAIAKLGYATVYQIGNIDNSAILLVAAAGILAALHIKKRKDALPVGFFLVGILAFALLGSDAHLPVHFYRFSLLIFLTVPLAAFSLAKFENKIFRLGICGIAFIAAFAAVFTSQGIHPEGYSTIRNVPDISQLAEPRLLVNIPPSYEPSPSELQQAIPLAAQVHAMRGVFVESSKNSKFIFDIERELDKSNINWGVIIDEYAVDSLGEDVKKLVPGQMDVFGINSVLTPLPPLEGWEAINDDIFRANIAKPGEAEEIVSYGLYRTGNSQLVQVLDFVPAFVPAQSWDEQATDWFLSGRVGNSLLVDGPVPLVKGTGEEKAWVIEQSRAMDYVKFMVDSQYDVPVLIKISHFPNWHAYRNGKEIDIYRASPYLMLIYGSGEIELRYQQEPSDLLGWLFTAAGLLIIAWQFLGKNPATGAQMAA